MVFRLSSESVSDWLRYIKNAGEPLNWLLLMKVIYWPFCSKASIANRSSASPMNYSHWFFRISR